MEKFNKKKVYSKLNQIIDNSINYGNIHLFVTIVFENIIEKDNFNNLYNRIEDLDNILKDIPLISYYYICYELHKKKRENCYHIHIFVAMRSLIGENKIILNNFENYLKDRFKEYDINTQYIFNEIEIKKKIQYCFKDLTTDNDNGLLRSVNEQYQYWADLIDLLQSNYNILYDYKIIEDKKNLELIRGSNNNNEENILLNLWSYYLILNNFFINKNEIYEKINNTIISFKKINSINNLIDDFLEKIYPYFLQNFQIQFENYPIEKIINKSFFYKNIKIENLEKIITNKIKINYNLLEFKDGLYDIKTNKFLPKNEIINTTNLKKIGTVKYYNKTYKNLSEPKSWLNNLKEVIKDENEIKILCFYIANIFHRSNTIFKNFFKKKKTLYIQGESNTKKTTLIAKPLISFFGANNVGFINKENNFKWENIIEKHVSIWDEFKYEKNMRGDLLKLLNEENLLIPKKYQTAELLENIPAIIIISNRYIDEIENDPIILQAFENRIQKIVFERSYSNKNDCNINENLEDLLKKEEANIIIYCNKLLYKEGLKRNRISYKKLKKLIETNSEEIT